MASATGALTTVARTTVTMALTAVALRPSHDTTVAEAVAAMLRCNRRRRLHQTWQCVCAWQRA